jgi:hypothetical protein
VEVRLRHKVDGWRDSAWSKKPTTLAGLRMIAVGDGMLMARSILVDVNRRSRVLVDMGRHRLKMVGSEAMFCGRVGSKRNSGGRSDDAKGIKDNEQTRCLLPMSIGQKSSHLLCYAGTVHPIEPL